LHRTCSPSAFPRANPARTRTLAHHHGTSYLTDILAHAKATSVHFFDVVPLHSTRVMGARAFMHVLVLATQGHVVPVQEGAYGDIELTPVAADGVAGAGADWGGR
jgi:hypothetical protein